MKQLTIIKWDKAYETGNFEIDAEHKIFVKIIEKIQAAYNEQQPTDYIESLITELIKYADFHFCSEENIMKSIGYPDLKNHQHLHLKLVEELKEQISVIDISYINMEELLDFITDWFAKHTVEEDKKIAEYIKRQNN